MTHSEPIRVLDLFSGAGGAGMGYHLAGFDVIGVDINPQPSYPFRFIQADAFEYATAHGAEYDLIHASPPCQRYSRLSACVPGTAAKYPDLIRPVRHLLQGIGQPWVIENVVGAPLIVPVTLCGTQFGLLIWWHRLFETSFAVAPLPCKHAHPSLNPHAKAGRELIRYEYGDEYDPEYIWALEKGIYWTTRREARQAIPPVYTQYIGQQYMASISGKIAV